MILMLKNKLKYLCLLFIVLSPFAVFAEEADILKIESYLNNLSTMQADFMQISPDGEDSYGSFYLSRPGKLRWDYKMPYEATILANQGIVTYYEPDLDQISNMPSGSNLAGFLIREKISLKDGVKITHFSKQKGVVRVSLIQTGKPEEGELTMVFTEKPFELKKLEVRDNNDLVTDIAFSNSKFSIDFNKNLFEINRARKNRLKN